MFIILIPISFQERLLPDVKSIKSDLENNTSKWKKLNIEKQSKNKVIWKKIEKNESNLLPVLENIKYKELYTNNNDGISSFNRSIVFNDSIVGPDFSWLVPPVFKWYEKYKFVASTRGHSGRFEKGRKGKSFWDGIAVMLLDNLLSILK